MLLMTALTLGSGTARGNKTLGTIAVAILLLGVLATLKIASQESAGLATPLGISYYTFRCVHYLLERMKQNLPPHTAAEFFAYLFFLPTLIAGPIHRFPEFHRDLRRSRINAEHASAGMERILYGFAKIFILVNYLLATQLEPAIARLEVDWPRLSTYLGMLAGGFTGYFLFAGYSDIAIGASRLMGFRIIENFNNPFVSRNIVQFWQRWHISLSSWVREYLYTGVFSITRRPYLAAFAAMLAIGLWHEISARYVLWGLAHGLAVATCQWYQRWHATKRSEATRSGILRPIAAWFVTFHFVMLSFVMVQHDMHGALTVYATLFGGRG